MNTHSGAELVVEVAAFIRMNIMEWESYYGTFGKRENRKRKSKRKGKYIVFKKEITWEIAGRAHSSATPYRTSNGTVRRLSPPLEKREMANFFFFFFCPLKHC